jgi:HlyD family secretion protein
MKKIILALLFTGTLVGSGLWFSRPGAPRPALPDFLSQTVVRVEKRDIDFTVEISGDVTPAFQLDVKPEVGGRLKAVHVHPGSTVHQGDLLVEIDDRDLLSERDTALTEIDGAKLEVEKHRRNFERAEELFESKLISREVYDNLLSSVAISENSLAKAQRKLQIVDDRLWKTKVLAPVDGTVLTVPAIEGQVVIAAASVNSGTTLMNLANLSNLLIDTHINQVDVSRIEVGQPVHIRAESVREPDMKAKIRFIAPVATVKNNVKGFQVQALIENPSPQLRPGMTVNMKVPIARANDAISVPIAAVFKEKGKKIVYVRSGESSEKRPVKIGVTNVDYAQILTGLTEGEEILLREPDRGPQKKS